MNLRKIKFNLMILVLLLSVDENNIYFYITEIEEVYGKSFEEKCTANPNCSDTDSVEIEVDTVPSNSQMDPYPLSYTLEHMGAGSSGILAAASKTNVDSKKVLLKINIEKKVEIDLEK